MTVSLAQVTEVSRQTVLELFFSRETTRAQHHPGPQEALLFPGPPEAVVEQSECCCMSAATTQQPALLVAWPDGAVTAQLAGGVSTLLCLQQQPPLKARLKAYLMLLASDYSNSKTETVLL